MPRPDTNLPTLQKPNRWPRGVPKYMVRVKDPSRLEHFARNMLKRAVLCARAGVPFHVKAYFYDVPGKPGIAEEASQFWAGIWHHFGFRRIQMLLTSTIIVEAWPDELTELLPRLPARPDTVQFKFVPEREGGRRTLPKAAERSLIAKPDEVLVWPSQAKGGKLDWPKP